MEENLKGVTPAVEVTTPTPEVEVGKATQPEGEPTVGITETPEFRKELDRALGKGLESTNRQLSIQKATADAMKAEAEMLKATQAKYKEDIESMEREIEKLAEARFMDDPDALKGYKNSRAIELKEKQVRLKEEKLNLVEAEQEAFRYALRMNEKANDLQKKHNVPREVLEACTSEEQMEKIAQSFPEIKPDDGKGEAVVQATKFASGMSSSGNEGWRGLSPNEKILYALSHPQKVK